MKLNSFVKVKVSLQLFEIESRQIFSQSKVIFVFKSGKNLI